MLAAEPKPNRNCVPRRDEENKSRVAARIAEHLAEKLLKDHPETYNPDCPPPLFTKQCYLLKKSSAAVASADILPFYLVPYTDPKCLQSKFEVPQGEYAYICIYNAARGEDEMRCGSNKNGMNVHLMLSGNAKFIVCAGELLFSETGKLLAWNSHSGSYRPEAKDAVMTGFPEYAYCASDAPLSPEPVLRSSSPSIPSMAGLAAMELKKLFKKTSAGAVDDSVLDAEIPKDAETLIGSLSKLNVN